MFRGGAGRELGHQTLFVRPQDCMLNGQCKLSQSGGACACDTPWTGPNCGMLGYATTPATAKSLYNISDPRNTWNGFESTAHPD